MDGRNVPDLKIVADDDTYYEDNDPKYADYGETMPQEYKKIKYLMGKGAQAKFMETNAEEHQLHHSKYLIFADRSDKFTAVFTGSANLTGAGFRTNWENSYYITIPEVVQQFADHYVKMWDSMATGINDLPKEGIVNEYLEDQPEIKK
jgi:phosphatidylserine/phosphatidylglycerophosphate/cardiolipin synthase-like enzyme